MTDHWQWETGQGPEDLELLFRKIARAPQNPGCYLWKAGSGEDAEILYIGKAKNLRKRIQSYLRPLSREKQKLGLTLRDTARKKKAVRGGGPVFTFKSVLLAHTIRDIEWIITQSEVEALLLEETLVKKHQPRFNVRLKDDKRYPYICLTKGEMYPRLYITRRTDNPHHRYFGPYTDVRSIRQSVALAEKIFPIRKKRLRLPLKRPQEPCLNYHIGRCLAPCTGQVDPENYAEVVREVELFLEGQHEQLTRELKSKMVVASEEQKYEQAAKYRDMARDIEALKTRQVVQSAGGDSFDALGIARRDRDCEAVLLFFREGKLSGKRNFALELDPDFFEQSAENPSEAAGNPPEDEANPGLTSPEKSKPGDPVAEQIWQNQVIELVLREFYLTQQTPEIRKLYLPRKHRELTVFEEAFQQKWGFRFQLLAPVRGEKRAITRLAAKNAEMALSERLSGRGDRQRKEALQQLREFLRLNRLPRVMECYDISHFQGTQPVASGVRFEDGRPAKSGYRRYTMKGYEEGEINDPGMIHEVICRRLQHLLNENKPVPDLFVIDGGRTQLARAVEAFEMFQVKGTAVVGLAKKHEEIYLPGQAEPVQFDPNSPALLLLRRIRDEAHRFAVNFHRQRRRKQSFRSTLREVRGLSEDKFQRVLKYLDKTPDRTDISAREMVREVPGVGPVLAGRIVEALVKKKQAEKPTPEGQESGFPENR